MIQDGVIAEDGSHSELMAQGGLYADMFESQAKFFTKKMVWYYEIYKEQNNRSIRDFISLFSNILPDILCFHRK